MYFFKVNKNNPQLSENPELHKFSFFSPSSLGLCWPPKTGKGFPLKKFMGKKKRKKILTLHKVFQGHGMKTFSAQQKQK